MSADLDQIDYQLLALLSQHGRMSHVELSQHLSLSPGACARRQKILEDKGIITGYRATLRPPALGLAVRVLVHVTLTSQADEALQAFETAALQCDCVTGCLLMTGGEDYLLTVVVKSIAEFERIHQGKLLRLPNVARIKSSFVMREVVKRDVPPSVFAAVPSTD